MYYHLIVRPDELITHEGFSVNLFKAFDRLLYLKINNLDESVIEWNKFHI